MKTASLRFERMQLSDLDEVMAIEQAVYTHPWGRVSFIDSLKNNDDAWVVRSVAGQLLGYLVQMAVVDEAHLLNIAVLGSAQNQGLGKIMLGFAVQQAALLRMKFMLLEVRVSNQPALMLYQQLRARNQDADVVLKQIHAVLDDLVLVVCKWRVGSRVEFADVYSIQ